MNSQFEGNYKLVMSTVHMKTCCLHHN